MLGAWMAISPWVLNTTVARTEAIIAGLVMLLIGVWAATTTETNNPEWTGLVAAVVLFVAPWVLGIGQTAMAWNAWIVAILLAASEIGALMIREGPASGSMRPT